MKKLFVAILAALSFNAFSQSYLIMDNGVVITNDKASFTYDFGHFAFPQKITLKGGRYFVEENSILATVDENGLLFRKYEVIPANIIGKGINYFMSEEGTLFTVDRKGVVIIAEHPELKTATNFGGNYFIVPVDESKIMGEIFTVNLDGQQSKAIQESIKITDIVAFGGTYFMTNRGIVHTVAGDGTIAPKPELRVGVIMKKGGNYFTDSSNTIFTIAEDGSLKIPAIPATLKIQAITKLGSNYFLDLSGKLFVVDHNGDVFERVMRDHDFRHARIISL